MLASPHMDILLLLAVVVSLGRNGFGGQTVDGDTVPATGLGADELENTNDDATMVTRVRTDDGAGATCDDADASKPFCEFDDLLIWIPESVLFNRLIQAGRLP